MADSSTIPAEPDPEDQADESASACAFDSPMFYVEEGYTSQNSHNSVAFLMRRVMRLFVNEIDSRLVSVGLTNAQWAPLFTIRKHQSTTLAELSRELHIDPGALTRTLDRLEAKGLCKRERSTEDRRVVNLALTPDGEAATAPVPGVLCEVMNAYLTGFSHEEWQMLLDFLRRMQANAEGLREQTLPSSGSAVPPPSA